MNSYQLTAALYLLGLVCVSSWLTRRVRTSGDFMVAGRRLGAPVLVGTLLATWIGSGSLFGGASLAYRKGLSALWFSLGAWLGMLVLFALARRIRDFAGMTVPEILEARYGVVARVLGTLTVVVAYTAITSYQFRAGGIVLELVLGIERDTGTLLTAGFVISYTALAGLMSVAYTDLINGLLMTVGLLFALPLLVASAGGLGALAGRLPAGHLDPLASLTPLEALGYSLPTLLLLLGESNMYQRFFAARDARAARRAALWMLVGVVLLETTIDLLGVAGAGLYPDLADPQQVIPHAVTHALGPLSGALVLAAMLAVVVSTADSFLLVPASNLVHDVYRRFISPHASERRLLLLSRLVVVTLGVLAWLQLRYFDSILEMALYAYTVYGAGITPAVLAAFLWRGARPWGGCASIAVGMLVTLVWERLVKPAGLHAVTLFGSPQEIDSVYPALVCSLLALLLGSLLQRGPADPAQLARFGLAAKPQAD